MVADIADTSEIARWFHAVACSMQTALFSYAAGSTLIDICTQSDVTDVNHHASHEV